MKPALLALLSAGVGLGAIALDTTSSGVTQLGIGLTGVTFSHTVGSGTGRYLVVTLAGIGGGGTAVFYGGVPLTKIASGSWTTEVWGLANPASGTANVVVNWTAFDQSYYDVSSAAFSLTGVDAGGPINVFGAGTGTVSQTVTTTVGGAWMVGSAATHNGNLSPSTGQTELVNWNSGGAATNAAGYIGPVSAGSNTMTWTASGGTGSGEGIAVVALQPAANVNVTAARRSYGQ